MIFKQAQKTSILLAKSCKLARWIAEKIIW